jgi:colanic acid/amylovoran biosynthesis glycosyltransferase
MTTQTSIMAYLINQYPAPSQTFIRREIAALESLGWDVRRFTLRRCAQQLFDSADKAEFQVTKVILDVGPVALLLGVVGALFAQPRSFFRAFLLALRLGRRSDRGLIVNLIYLAEACTLRRWLVDCGARHVHAHFGTNSSAVALLCRSLGGPPYSFTVHGPEEFDGPRALSLGEKVRGASFVVAISEFTRSQLNRWSQPNDWEKIHVIRCGVDSSYLTKQLPPPPTEDCRRFVCVGRLSEQKGQLVLVQAAARLAADGREFEIVLVGDGPMRDEIEQRIEKSQLGRHIRLLGWKDGAGVRDELIQSRALVLPSFAEGLPVVLMESLALARPVISTYVAGIPELVEPGVNGWLVPSGSIEALAQAMAECLDTPIDRLASMGRAGAASVAKRHDAAVEAAKLHTLLTFTSAPGASEKPVYSLPQGVLDGDTR